MSSLSKLQALIDRCTKQSNAAHHAQSALYEYCEKAYGCIPGDHDLDDILDAVFAASGAGGGMSAVQFHALMSNVSHKDNTND